MTSPALLSAKAPSNAGPIAPVGVVLALVTVILGGVGVHDALVSAEVTSGPSWIESGIEAGDGLEPQWWMVPVGALLVLAGLYLLWAALHRRTRRGASVNAATGVFVRPRDLRILARQAAEDVDGVIDVDARASRVRVRIHAIVTADDGQIAEDVRSAVQQALSVLDPVPRIKVTTDARGLS